MSQPHAGSRPAIPRVALLIKTQIGPGRDMLQGIARYVRESGPWELHLEPRMQQFVEGWEPTWLHTWKGDGIIARFETDSVLQAAKRLGVPAVDLLGSSREHVFPYVHPDDRAIGEMAARHLLERGFKQFGFVGRPGASWSDLRFEAFARTVAERGHQCSFLEVRDFRDLAEQWDAFIDRTARWIANLPKPLGLMVCYDQLGPPVMQACRHVGVAVPEDVAMIGADNDLPFCSICNPPLSTVNPNHEEVGYQAAAMLGRMMAGEAWPTQPLRIAPRGIVIRQSTEVAAIDDPIVSLALSMIREQACNGLRVREVAERVPVSGTVLQRRFRAVMGRSVHEEIVRVQLKKAQDLLRETDLPLKVVAEKTGFKHQEYMGAVFKSRLSVTPGQYRRRYQQPAGLHFDPGRSAIEPLPRASRAV